VTAAFSDAAGSFASFVGDAGSVITDPITSLWDGVSSLFGGISHEVKKLVEKVFRTIEHQLAKVWGWITDQVHHLWHDLVNVEHEVAGGIGWLAHAAGSAITSGLDTVRQWVLGLLHASEAAIKAALSAGLHGLRDLVNAASSGLAKLAHAVASIVPAPVRHAIDAVITWVRHNVWNPLVALVKAEVNAIRKGVHDVTAWVGDAVRWVAHFGGWVLKLLRGAEGFLLWIARYSWHEIVDVFELLMHPDLRHFAKFAKDSTEPLFAPIEHQLAAVLS
jgi:hypothetical protein